MMDFAGTVEPLPYQSWLPLLGKLLLMDWCQDYFPALHQEYVPTGKEIMQGMFYQQELSSEAKLPRVENTFGAMMEA